MRLVASEAEDLRQGTACCFSWRCRACSKPVLSATAINARDAAPSHLVKCICERVDEAWQWLQQVAQQLGVTQCNRHATTREGVAHVERVAQQQGTCARTHVHTVD
eukprot:354622-Chlamydomonas_euryale.AAC.16